MNAEKINIRPQKINVLVAPLDWGLGHATRCIPIIHELLSNGCAITIAASGPSAALLQKEFPQLPVILIRGYNIRYTRNKFLLPLYLLWQFPGVCFRIAQEYRWLKKWTKNNPLDIIISDNRVGMFHRTIHSCYITHQLKIKTGNIFTEYIAQKIHYFFINKYQQCWVPDAKNNNNLAGELSHPIKLPKIPVTYIGPLSRFEQKKIAIKYDLLFLISGPEPQRTIFEELIFENLKNYNGSALVIRGLPHKSTIKNSENREVKVVNHLSAQELNDAINQSQLVISRSGYTTIMDLIKVKKNAILVPTPGQTEQEYLAKYLKEKKYFLSICQSDFNVENILKNNINDFNVPFLTTNLYKEFIKEALSFNKI
jgi:uncharacterized protein (TIGR00661 family)